ncbi:unnamed protein product [Dicrocoelium dendriticum]|nr:unnamed protein product [Dicrocoelium dendriticum]
MKLITSSLDECIRRHLVALGSAISHLHRVFKETAGDANSLCKCSPLSDSVSRTPSAPYSAPSEPSSLTGAPMSTTEPLTSKPILPLASVPDLICSASILSSSSTQRPLEPTVLVECQTSSSAVSIDSFDDRADSPAVSPAHLHRSPLIASHLRSAGDLPSLHQPTSFLSSYQTPSASTEQFDEIHSDNQPVFGNHSDPSPTSFVFSSELPDGVHSCSLRAQHFSEDVSVQTGVSPSPTPLNRRPDSNRCSRCRRRTGPVGGFSCRCGRWFCIKHHHPEDHCCDYDFKTMKPAHSTISVAIPPVITDSVRR